MVHSPSSCRSNRYARLCGAWIALFPIALNAQRAGSTPTMADSGRAQVHIAVAGVSGPLSDALVRSGQIGAQTDAGGHVTLTVPAGQRTIVASKIGFRSDSVTLRLRANTDTAFAFTLIEQAASVAPIIVTATRTEQRVEAVPLRVEVLAGEDIGEKNAVRPGDLTQMVAEIPGVRVQSSSPGLGGATLRVQGFRGEYTKFLTDGLPLGSAGDAGFWLVEQPPLDLAQV
jgi:outer membrane receptor for ferrienterochelin and colicins